MKHLFYTIIALLVLIVVSCEPNQGLLIPNDFSDFVYTSSTYKGHNDTSVNYVAKNKAVSFMNLSQGALSMEWEISEGCRFVNSAFEDTTTNFAPYYIEGTKLNDTTVHVVFEQGPKQMVTLRTTFAEEKTYQPNSLEIYKTTFDSVQGVHVMEVRFEFVILEEVGFAYEIYQGSTLITTVGLDQEPASTNVQLYQGDSLTVKSTQLIGMPDKVEFTANGEPEIKTQFADNAFTSKLVYNTLGTFKMGSIALIRTENEGDKIPAGQMKKVLPINVEVMYKAAPIDFKKVTSVNENEIVFEVNRNGIVVDQAATADFSIVVNNAAKGITDKVIAVSSVAASEFDITLTLAEPIYGDDEIKMSYVDNGNVKTEMDDRMTAFSDVEVLFGALSMVNQAIYGFEEGAWTTTHADNVSFEGGKARTGSKSYNYTQIAKKKWAAAKLSDKGTFTTDLVAGENYNISCWVYLEDDYDGAQGQLTFTIAGQKITHNINSLSKGEWVECVIPFTADAATTADSFIQISIDSSKAIGSFHVDDINVTKPSVRP